MHTLASVHISACRGDQAEDGKGVTQAEDQAPKKQQRKATAPRVPKPKLTVEVLLVSAADVKAGRQSVGRSVALNVILIEYKNVL